MVVVVVLVVLLLLGVVVVVVVLLVLEVGCLAIESKHLHHCDTNRPSLTHELVE